VKRRSIPFLLCAVFSLGSVLQAAATSRQTLIYEVKLKSLSFGNMGTRRMYIKGDNMRWEGKVDRLPFLAIKNSQGAFLIHPWQKIAARYPAESNRNNPRTYLPGPTESPRVFLAKVKATRCGRETVEKRRCDLWSYFEPTTRRTCRLWVDAKTGKPVKIMLVGVKKRMDTIVGIYTKFIVGARISDSLFELPKGCAVRPMPYPKGTALSTTNPLASAATGLR